MRLIPRLFICFFIAISATSFAQQTRDVVYLKNGSVIKGKVVEVIPGGNITIKTSDGSVFVYPMENLQKMEQEAPAEKNQNQPEKEVHIAPSNFILASIGPAINVATFDRFNLIPKVTIGHRFNNYLAFGIGAETNSYSFYDNSSIRVIPIYFESRFFIPSRGKVFPMFNIKLGYAVGGSAKPYNFNYEQFSGLDFWPMNHTGGSFMALGIGMGVNLNKNMTFIADFGFSLQELKGYTTYYNTSNSYILNSEKRGFGSLGINVGIAINLAKSAE